MDKREQMANQLLMRGHATMDELLEASFGEWPPKGLEILHRNEQVVQLHTQLQSFDTEIDPQEMHPDGFLYKEVGGLGRIHGERSLYVRGDLKMKSSTLGHEAAHVLQGDHSYRAQEYLGHDYSRITPPSNDYVQAAIDQHFALDQLKSRLRKAWKKATKKDEQKIETYAAYLARGIEVQARIHEIMLAGYPRWGRLPATTEELQSALIAAGLTPPKQLRTQLQSLPDHKTRRETFKHWKPLANRLLSSLYWMANRMNMPLPAASDINFIQKGLSSAGHVDFWQATLPKIYADLIEMYGDKPGRARFGLGRNEIHAARLQHQQDIARLAATEWQTYNDTGHIYAAVTPKESEDLMASLANLGIGCAVTEKGRFVWVDFGDENALEKALGKKISTPPEVEQKLAASVSLSPATP